MSDDEAVQVLVAGAGPVGLTAAHELVRRGVRVRVVDKASGPATTSRALATHARTMEICDQMGVLDRLMPLGRPVEHFSLHQGGKLRVRFDTDYRTMPTRFPFSLMVDQVVTERVLREHLSELGVEVEWGVELTSFEPHTDSVSATLRHADGRVEEITAGWLVGTDGARSTVRKRLGLELLGETTLTWLNVDVQLDTDLPPDSNHLLFTDDGTLLLVPFPEPGKWRVVDTTDCATDAADDPEAIRARLAGKISRTLGRTVLVSSPTWLSVFTVQQRMIRQMRVGRVFVAGDAAHIHSPASGQGMNTGIQDAYNLAWKLADVVHGFAEDALLDSYGAERVPIGETLLGSTRKATAMVALRNKMLPILMPPATGLLNFLYPIKRKLEGKLIRGFCGLALHYAQSPLSGAVPGAGQRVGCTAEDERTSQGWRELIAELRDPRWKLLAFTEEADLDDIAHRHSGAMSVRTVSASARGHRPLADPDGLLRKGLGVPPGHFVLIRPDGYVATSGPVDSLELSLRESHLVPGPVVPLNS